MGSHTRWLDETSGGSLARALEILDLALADIDLDGRVVSWSAASERMLGYTADEVVGTAYASFVPTQNAGEIRKGLDKLSHGRSVPPLETRRRHRDGHLLDVIFTLHPRTDAQGRVIGAHTTLRDVSSTKETERQLRHSTTEIEAILKTVLDGIVTINEQGIVEAFNPAAERIFGYRAHEMIGRNVKMLMPEPTRSEHDGYLQRYLRTGVPHVIGIGREITGRRKDGTLLPLELAIAPMQIGDRRSFVGVLHDISERKQAERELQELNQVLRDKVIELGDTLARLQQTQAQLVQAEKMASLGALVAGVAHEINTPIGICVTAASVLQDAAAEATRAAASGTMTSGQFDRFMGTVNEAVKLLASNTRRASSLIGSFKQVAVDRSNGLSRRFDLRGFLDELLQSLRPALRRHRVEIECAGGIVLNSLPGALAQLITNLLVNATQHAFKGDQAGLIRIDVEQAGDHVLLGISDNGVGIPPENLKRIFDPFFTTARGRGGTGLGLHIAFNLVTQALGGTITVRSRPGDGTTFTVRIPLNAPGATAAAAAA